MASILKKVTRASKTLLNPVTAVNPVATTKAALSITPVNTTSAAKVAAALVNPNPLSSDKMALTRAAMNPNPLETAKQTVAVFKDTISTSKPTAARVVPDRESYSAAASSTESERARIMAQRMAEQNAAKVVPDRESYSAAASAKESITNLAKNAAEQKSAEADQTPAVQNATVNDNQYTAAANAAAATPGEMRIIIDAGNAAREAAMVEQKLPEVVVESDYKKYLLWGAIALACVVAFKKLK